MNERLLSYFNLAKLPDYIEEFGVKKVAIIGTGAVGSYGSEMLFKMGVIHQHLIDFDPFEAENMAKSSCLYRIPEDVGRNKAQCLAERENSIIGGNTVHGIDANITCFGPMAFAGFDLVILALDNYAAKVYFNQIWRQIPADKRPVVIFGGTVEECAQSNCLDGKEACIRCLFDEKWLENMLHRTSCSGPQYRQWNGQSEIVKTTGLASRISADLMVEQCRHYFLGGKEGLNRRLMYNPYPMIGITQSKPMDRKTCPDCKNYHPIEDAKVLKGMDVLHSTVGDLMDAIEAEYGMDDFEIEVPMIEFAKIAYSGLIVKDYCRSCGKEMPDVYRHVFRTKEEDVLCNECKRNGRKAFETAKNEKVVGEDIKAITRDNCTAELRSRKLYDVGFTVGGFIEVIRRKADCVDIMDRGIESHMYYLENDPGLLDTITELEG